MVSRQTTFPPTMFTVSSLFLNIFCFRKKLKSRCLAELLKRILIVASSNIKCSQELTKLKAYLRRNSSKTVFRRVFLDLPFCKSHQIRIYGIAKHENALITCQVESNPDILSYKWYFNNSMESIEVNSRNYSKFGSSNSVIYTPKTELDYGTLFCWATNPIGQQIVPCLYHIIAAGNFNQHMCTFR